MSKIDTPIVKPAAVRMATPADEKALCYALRALQSSNFDSLPFARVLPVDSQKVRDHATAACNGNGGWAGIIDDGAGNIIATTGIFALRPWWTSEWGLSTYWVFIDEDHRTGTHHARDLFQFGLWLRQELSQKAGYELPLETSVLSTNRLDAKLRLWRRYATMVGGLFMVTGE